jgi:hypothetical protein
MKNQRGQFTVEAILLMVAFMGILLLVTNFFNSKEILGSLVKGPWTALSGMLENGEWMAAQQSQALHPSQHSRHVTIDGVSGTGGGNNYFLNPGYTP